MRNLFIFLLGVILSAQTVYSQSGVQTWTENFDGNVSFTASPPGSWGSNSVYYVPNSSGATPKSYLGLVPNMVDSTSILLTTWYDFTNMDFVIMRFSHICKVSPKDMARIEYRFGSTPNQWDSVPAYCYMGKASGFALGAKFSASSYSEWQANDSTVLPQQSWWKDEMFDLSDRVGGDNSVQFRFIIRHGSTPGTQASYGWLLDNFEITASTYQIYPPVVEFVAPLVRDTVYRTGPWEINAKVKTSTKAPIVHPWLVYTATFNGNLVARDSVLMTHVRGDSLWKFSIPQFVVGTNVTYSITGRDTNDNYTTAYSGYYIQFPPCGDVGGGGSGADMTVPATGNNSYTTCSGTLYPHLGPASGYTGGYGNSCNGYTVLYPATPGAVIQISGTYATESCCDYIRIYDGIGTGGTLLGEYRGITAPTVIPDLTSTTGPLTVYFYSDGSVNTASNAAYTGFAIDVSCSMDGRLCLDNSAAMYSIDMFDTMAVSPVNPTPVVVTVKNTGDLNLGFVTVSYSINGSAPVSNIIHFNPALPWDFNHQDTVDYYNPRMNGFDTITVWVSLPNGSHDSTTYDDTLTKIIYGTADIFAEFVEVPTDTVFSTGIHEITARITSLTGNPIGTVYLYVTDTSASTGVRNYHTLIMLPQGGGIWSAEIFNIPFESDVEYTLSTTDFLGNIIEISGNYYVKRVGCTTSGGVGGASTDYLYTGSMQTVSLPAGVYEIECWGADGGTNTQNTGIAGKGGYSNGVLTLSMPTTCYLYVGGKGGNTVQPLGGFNSGNGTTKTNLGTSSGGGGASDIRVLVDNLYNRIIVAGGGGGQGTNSGSGGDGGGLIGDNGHGTSNYGIGGTQTAPGLYPGGGDSKPAAFGEGGDGPAGTTGGQGGGGWYGGSFGTRTDGGGAGGSGYVLTSSSHKPTGYFSTYANYYLNNAITVRPSEPGFITNPATDGNGYVRITPVSVGGTCLDHSVGMESILSPEPTMIAGTFTPVTVRIRNRGVLDLDSCYINWSLNGTVHPDTVVYRNTNGLPEDFIDTITIGYYTVSMTGLDEIIVWVRLPNGEVDSLTMDDTLTVSPIACPPSLSLLTVGTGADYPTINSALEILRSCGVSNNITLALKGTFAENLNLTDWNFMNGYHLTITSLDNDPDSAVIRPASGVAVRLNKASNITFDGITINSSAVSAHVVEFAGAATNIVFTHCNIMGHPTTTGTYHCFNKGNATGALDGLTVKHCNITGGYYGFYMNLASADRPNFRNVVVDSNVISGQYYTGVYFNYARPQSISYNKITPRSSSQGTTWYGINAYEVRSVTGNSQIMGNIIRSDNAGISSDLYGMRTYYIDNILVANNEIYLNSSAATTYGIYIDYPYGTNYINNSVLLTGTGGSTFMAVYWYTYQNSTYSANMENNILVANGGTNPYAIYMYADPGATYRQHYVLDYNTYYTSGANLGYSGADRTNLAAWQAIMTADIHSVNILPNFINPATDLSYLFDINLTAPRISTVMQDINGTARRTSTNMGAYEVTPIGQDLMLMRLSNWTGDLIESQNVQLAIDVMNLGTVPVTQATFGWSVNGNVRPSVPWNASPSLASLAQTTIPIGTFTATGVDTFDIVVWLESINNGQQDTDNHNDTVSSLAPIVLLAEFVPPLLEDTLLSINFDVNAIIRTITGAPILSPQLMLTTTVNGYTLYDSVPMTLSNGIWTAAVSSYYNSHVVYSLTVEDALGNISTITDSVYIKLSDLGKSDSVIIGTGTTTSYQAPINLFYNYSWTRQTYLYSEISPNNSPIGVYIASIAWQSIAATNISNNQTCYMRAVSATAQSGGYTDPLVAGASLVWTGTLNISPGWVSIVLDTLFFLPSNMHLEIFWNNQHGNYPGSSHTWAHTATAYTGTAHGYSDNSFATAQSSTYSLNSRPNIKIITLNPSSPYPGNNLGLMKVITPVIDPNNLCSEDYSPVQVQLINLGENEHNFAQNNITVTMEAIDPFGTKYTSSISLQTGTLGSCVLDTIELIAALPVMYTGSYSIKAWITNSVDNVLYDDTLYYTYLSSRVSLPIDEDFSGAVLSEKLLSIASIGTDKWYPYMPDVSDPVQPANGTGVLIFDGNHGSMSVLTTRQLDLYGSVQPQLEYWYYQDASLPITDNSYTDVNIIIDGISHNLRTLYKRGTTTGWYHDVIDLTPYTMSSGCLLIQFEAMNKGSYQYFDRIFITSLQDLSVSQIIITGDALDVCNMNNREIKAVIQPTTSQDIDLTTSQTFLVLEFPGYKDSVSLQGKRLQSNIADTVTLTLGADLPIGSYPIKAYVNTPADQNPLNDTAKYIVNINPKLSIEVTKQTEPGNCLDAETEINQPIVIENTGDVTLSNFRMHLSVIVGSSLYMEIEETVDTTLNPGDIFKYTFNNNYLIPWNRLYSVNVKVMGCDSVKIYAENTINECANIRNLEIVSIDNPSGTAADTIGRPITVKITLRNVDDLNNFQDIKATVTIKGSNGVTAGIPFSEAIPFSIPSLEEAEFTFTQTYTVPEDSWYSLIVSISDVNDDKLDNFPNDNTITVTRTATTDVGITEADGQGISLSQNIPNPANDNTVIPYSIPSDGSVTFNVYSISGQVLYSQTVETTFGAHSIELNTSDLAAGLYFYSMEFKGQRLVKRMIIER